MIFDKQHFITQTQNRFRERDVHDKNIIQYRFTQVLSLVCMCLSSYYSYNFWDGITNNIYLAIICTCLFSILIMFLGYFVTQFWVSYKSFNIWGVLLLLSVAFNIFADLQGVQFISQDKHPMPKDSKTETLSNNHQTRIESIENELKHQRQTVKQTSVWNKDKEHPNWQMYNKHKQSKQTVQQLVQQIVTLNSKHSQTLSNSLKHYTQTLKQTDANRLNTVFNYRFFATICTVIYILCLIYQIWFLRSVFKVFQGTNSLPENKIKETKIPEKSVFKVFKQPNTFETNSQTVDSLENQVIDIIKKDDQISLRKCADMLNRKPSEIQLIWTANSPRSNKNKIA